MFPRRTIKKPTLSTGPRTDAGKATSSKNSLRHGLASGRLLIAGEDPEEFALLLKNLLEEWSPATQTEQLHVENMARHQWLVERACQLQSRLLYANDVSELPPSFTLLIRYQTTNERAFIRAQKVLEAMQQTRKQQAAKPQEEFVSQNNLLPKSATQRDLEFPTGQAPEPAQIPEIAPKVAHQGAS